MDYLIYTAVAVLAVLLVYGMLTAAEEEVADPTPHDEPNAEHPELAPDVYAHALVYLLVEAELRGLEQVRRNGNDEAGKGAKV